MSFTAPLTRFENTDLWYAYLPVSDDVANQFIDGTDRRVIVTLEGTQKYHTAIMHLGNMGEGGKYFLNVNKRLRDALKLEFGQPVAFSIEKDTSEYGRPMPEEFREVMNQDPDFDKLFHSQTPGTMRSLLYWAGNVKSPDIKIRRAFVVAEHLKANNGELDWKALNAELKAANQAAKLR